MYIPVGVLVTQNPKLKMQMLMSTILILNFAHLTSFTIEEQRKVLSKTSVPTPTPPNLTIQCNYPMPPLILQTNKATKRDHPMQSPNAITQRNHPTQMMAW